MLYIEKKDNIKTMESFGANEQFIFKIFFFVVGQNFWLSRTDSFVIFHQINDRIEPVREIISRIQQDWQKSTIGR